MIPSRPVVRWSLLSTALVIGTLTAPAAQSRPAPLDWAAVESRGARPLPGAHPVRHERQRAGRGRVPQEAVRRAGHPGADPRQGPRAAQRHRPAEGQRPQASAAAPRPPRHRDRGRVEMEVPAVQRHPRRRLRLRPRRHRRQGQPDRGADGDAAAQAAERRPRPRRDPAGRVGRGGRVAARHRLHDGRALPADRRRVPASPRVATRSARAARCAMPPRRCPRRSSAAWS